MSTNPVCETVAERVALGEPLGDVAEHAGRCERCKLVVAMPGTLGATHNEVDPGLGFAARMTVGAQARIATRRRRRVAAGLGATVAAGVLGVFLFTRPPATSETAPTAAGKDIVSPAPEVTPLTDEELKGLVRFADVGRNLHLSANWHSIKKPLSPYRKLLQGVVAP